MNSKKILLIEGNLSDIAGSYDLGGNSNIRKSVDFGA